MKIVGIIAEYNPFHNGHQYHLEQSRKLTGADCVVAVMSGNFTQRGEAAVLDKWTRSRLAVENGVDLVLELPFLFACSRAEQFAAGAVDLLAALGADFLSFGSESGDLAELRRLAEALDARKEELDTERHRYQEKGVSFAKANEQAVSAVLGKEQAALLLTPNNILAIEYLKRILYWEKRGQGIKTTTVKRHGSGYFEENETQGFAGASCIRQALVEGGGRQAAGLSSRIRKYVPANVAKALAEADDPKEAELRFFQLVRGELVRSPAEELANVYCMGEGLENKLKKEIRTAASLEDLIASVVSKRYTEAAIRRLLTYVLLGVKGPEPERALYGRVLAASKEGQALLRERKRLESPTLPLITNINKEAAQYEKIGETLRYDQLASDMYHLLRERDLYAFSDKVLKPYME